MPNSGFFHSTQMAYLGGFTPLTRLVGGVDHLGAIQGELWANEDNYCE